MGEILPLLSEQEVVIIQSPTITDGIRGLRTILIHAPSGTQFEDTMALTGKEDPQGQGSAITYARRYALMSILGLVADEDDDGSEATGVKTVARKKTKTEPGTTPTF